MWSNGRTAVEFNPHFGEEIGMQSGLPSRHFVLLSLVLWLSQSAFTSSGSEIPKIVNLNSVEQSSHFHHVNSSPSMATNLQDLVKEVSDGRASQPEALYLPGGSSLTVVRQPAGSPGYVSASPTVATNFTLAEQRGVHGFLAHADLGGKKFQTLSVDDLILMITGDGQIQSYSVFAILRFQAVRPNDPFSEYIDLDHGEARLTNREVFAIAYGLSGSLVLQTCMSNDGDDAWGRLFVIATPKVMGNPLAKSTEIE